MRCSARQNPRRPDGGAFRRQEPSKKIRCKSPRRLPFSFSCLRNRDCVRNKRQLQTRRSLAVPQSQQSGKLDALAEFQNEMFASKERVGSIKGFLERAFRRLNFEALLFNVRSLRWGRGAGIPKTEENTNENELYDIGCCACWCRVRSGCDCSTQGVGCLDRSKCAKFRRWNSGSTRR